MARDEGRRGEGRRGAGRGGTDLDEQARLAWQDLTEDLAMHLGHSGEPVVLQALSTSRSIGTGVRAPYVQCVTENGEHIIEVASNHYLPAGRRWTAAQKRQIRELGFERPCTVREFVEGERTRANYRAVFPWEDVEEAAALAVRALTDVLGAIHPALLDAGVLSVPAPGPLTGPGPDVDEDSAHEIASEEDLLTLVDKTLARATRQRLVRERDESWSLACGRTIVTIRVWEEAPFVELSCPVVGRVPSPAMGRRLAAYLNERAVVERYVLEGDGITMRLALLARPFVPRHFTDLLEGFMARANSLDERFNGGHSSEPWPESA